jgi:small GTP-binding protein
MKVLVCGAAGVGRKTFLSYLARNKFNQNFSLTSGADILSMGVELTPGEMVELSLWYIGGQSRFQNIRRALYKGTSGAIFVFDLTLPESLDQVAAVWLPEVLKSPRENLPFLLVGNKVDLVNESSDHAGRDGARELAEQNGMHYIEVSAISETDISEVFLEFTRQMVAFHNAAT